jgi:hypothetical protein
MTTDVQSVSITTRDGTFTAPTLRAAKKLATVARAEADKKHKASAARIELAMLRAKAFGFRLLRHKAELGHCKGWDYHPAGGPYFAATVKPTTTRDHYHVEASPGGVVVFVSYPIVGCVSTANGYVGSLVVSENGKECVYAVGAEGESYCLEPVPGVGVADFTPAE